MADIAESVNIGPSALYRHFSSKADLLFEAVDQTITAFAAMVAELPARDLEGIARSAARTAIAYRPLGVLWQREARNLPGDQHLRLRRHLRNAILTLGGTLREIRPDLDPERAEFLAAAGVNAMTSISFHRLSLPEPAFEEVLTDLALRVLTYEFDDRDGDGNRATLPAPVSRREEIADAAAALFARHGYDAVGTDDIGAAVGIAGPTLYNHFTSKQDLLLASLTRGYDLLETVVDEALDGATDPQDALRRLTRSFVDLAFDHSDLVTNLIAESRNLGEEYQDAARQARVDHLERWTAVIRAQRPEEDPVVSVVKVQAAQMLANAMCRTLYLRGRDDFRRDLAEICRLLVA